MSVISFPTTLIATRMTIGQQRNDLAFRSSFGSQGLEVSAPLWTASLESGSNNDSNSVTGAFKALLLQLKGQVNQLSLWDLGRPAPLGTMRGTMTFNGNHAQNATALNISASGEAGKTLLQGDMLGFGTGTTQQVVMVVTGGTSDGSGNISVTVEPPLRNAFTSGAGITWDKPCILFRRTVSAVSWDYQDDQVSGLKLDLIEDWRA